jgi:hypothetical protein
MPILVSLLIMLQLCVISGAPVYASQSVALATTETTPDDIIPYFLLEVIVYDFCKLLGRFILQQSFYHA